MKLDRSTLTVPLICFAIAAVVRLVAALPPIARINPFAQDDVHGFAAAAARQATRIANGNAPEIAGLWNTYDVWGAMLAPFWLLPGPSHLYARVVLGMLGAVCVYLVADLAERYHSPLAGLLAALPLACYPSIVLVQATILRESVVLIGLVAPAYLLLLPRDALAIRWRVLGCLLIVPPAVLSRVENLPFIILAVAIGMLVHVGRRVGVELRHGAIATAASVSLSIPVLSVAVPGLVEQIATVRKYRAKGRTAYLPEMYPTTMSELALDSLHGLPYFYWSPLPFQIHRLADLVVGVEALCNIALVVAAVWGFKSAVRRAPARLLGLLGGFLAVSLLYGFVTANVGTAVRHRQMFLWIIMLFGGIGFADVEEIKSRANLR